MTNQSLMHTESFGWSRSRGAGEHSASSAERSSNVKGWLGDNGRPIPRPKEDEYIQPKNQTQLEAKTA